MRESILLTVHDREPAVFLNTLRWLQYSLSSLGDLKQTEIVVVDDGSHIDYRANPFFQEILERLTVRWVLAVPYERFSVDETGYGGPSRAFNVALGVATAPRVVIMSSDVLVPPNTLTCFRGAVREGLMYTPRVVDLGTGTEYVGPSRLFPAPWFLGVALKDLKAIGGWDEEYLKGLCYEDNDLAWRLLQQVKEVLFDYRCGVWHQSHRQFAYEKDNLAIRMANERNELYTIQKHGFIPFAPGSPMHVNVTPDSGPHWTRWRVGE